MTHRFNVTLSFAPKRSSDVHKHIHIHAYTYTRTHIYAHTHIHTCTYTYMVFHPFIHPFLSQYPETIDVSLVSRNLHMVGINMNPNLRNTEPLYQILTLCFRKIKQFRNLFTVCSFSEKPVEAFISSVFGS